MREPVYSLFDFEVDKMFVVNVLGEIEVSNDFCGNFLYGYLHVLIAVELVLEVEVLDLYGHKSCPWR